MQQAIDAGTIDRAIECVRLADGMMKRAEYPQAEEMFREVLGVLPELPEVNLHLGKAYYHQKKLRDAGKALVRELAYNPKASLGEIERYLGRIFAEQRPEVIPLEFRGEKAPKSWPEISLFMIIKNEEKYLERCLESVKDLVSEMIVLDTGSTDRSVEIAERFGAKVYHYEWDDDFAAARNEALKYPTREWVLMMDADNWLLPAEANKLKWAATSYKADLYLCDQMTWNTGEKAKGDSQVRLFRNGRGLRYASALHETLVPSALEHKLVIGATNIRIEHEAFVLDEDKLKHKRERNLVVLDKALAKEPGNVVYQILRANVLYELRRLENIQETLEAILSRVDDSYSSDLHLSQVYSELTNELVKNKEFEKLSGVLLDMLADFPFTVWVWASVGNLLTSVLGQPAWAARVLNRAAGLKVTEEDRQRMRTEDVEGELFNLRVRALFYAGERDRAAVLLLGRKSKLGQSEVDRRRILGEIQMKEGALDEALKIITPVSYQDMFTLRLAASICAAKEQWKEASNFQCMYLTWRRDPVLEDWEKLVEYENRSGCFAAASCAVRMAQQVCGENAAVLALGGVAALQRSRVDEAMLYLVKALLLEPENQGYRANLDKMAQGLGLEVVDLVRTQGIRWVKAQEYQWARKALELAMELNPGDEQAGQLLAMLQKLG